MSSPRGMRAGSPLHASLASPSSDAPDGPGSPPDVSTRSTRPVSIDLDLHDLGTASAAPRRAPQIGGDSGIGNQAPTAERTPPRDPCNEVPSSLSDRIPDLVLDIASRAHSPQLPPAFIAPLGLERDLKTLLGATRNRDHKHTCPVCGQFYRRPYLLKDHMVSHQPTNGKRHLCDFAECSLTFTSRSNMRRHFKQKHQDVDGTHNGPSPVESASCVGDSIEPGALKVKGSGGSIAKQNLANSPLPSAREADNGPVPKDHSLQPALNGPSMINTTIDSSRELGSELTTSKKRKRSGEPKYAPRVKIPCYDTAYTLKSRTGSMIQLSRSSSVVDTGYGAFNLKTKDNFKDDGNTRITRVGLQAAKIEPRYEARPLSYTENVLHSSSSISECEASIMTPVSQFRPTRPMETKHITREEDTRTNQDMTNVYDGDTTMAVMVLPCCFVTGSDCGYMHVANGIANANYSAPPDSVESIGQGTRGIPLGTFILLGSPVHHPQPKVLDRFIKAVGTVMSYTATVRIPAKHFGPASTLSPTNSLYCARVFLTDHFPQMSQHTLMSASSFLRALGVVLEPRANMGIQDASRAVKQPLDVSFTSLYALLPLACSEGVPDDIAHALLNLLHSARAQAGLPFFLTKLTQTHCKELHLSASPPQPVVSRPLFNRANPGFSTGNLVIADPCTPGSTLFGIYAPSTPRFIKSASFPFATEVKPSYQDLLPELDMNRATSPWAWHVGYDLAAWHFSHDFGLSASRATRKTLPMDVTSVSTSRAPVLQCISLSTTDAPQPVPETSLKFKEKDHQRHGCSSCDRTFRRPYLLKDHMQSKHRNGERPYTCDFEECNRAFSTRSNLRKHFRTKHTDLGSTPIVSETNID